MSGLSRERPITIVLADDHTVIRGGLRMLLDAEEDFAVVAEAGTVAAVYQQVRAKRPDVLVLDLNMPGETSLTAIPRLMAFAPRMAIVILTMEHDPALAREAARAGARGFVLKDAAEPELVRAIRAAVGD